MVRGFHSKLLNCQADLDARRVFQWSFFMAYQQEIMWSKNDGWIPNDFVYFKYGSIATIMAKNGVFNNLICFLY